VVEEPWWIHKQLTGCTLHKWRDVTLLDKDKRRIGEYRYCINCGEQAKVVIFNYNPYCYQHGTDFSDKLHNLTQDYLKRNPY
jgi:hypothetical protein